VPRTWQGLVIIPFPAYLGHLRAITASGSRDKQLKWSCRVVRPWYLAYGSDNAKLNGFNMVDLCEDFYPAARQLAGLPPPGREFIGNKHSTDVLSPPPPVLWGILKTSPRQKLHLLLLIRMLRESVLASTPQASSYIMLRSRFECLFSMALLPLGGADWVVIENQHSTDIESPPPPPRRHGYPQGESCSDLGRVLVSQ
jgi:hypothetical protein